MSSTTRTLQHRMLLRSKNVMDDAMCELSSLNELVPEKLHGELEKVLARFEDTLCECDVSGDVEMLTEYLESAKRKKS